MQICQSCGMTMERDSEFGTESNGRYSKDYCSYCYQGGAFTDPDITLEEMIEKVIELENGEFKVDINLRSSPFNPECIRSGCQIIIPKLKRWSK